MVFNLYLSDEITNSHIPTNKYKIFQYSIKKMMNVILKNHLTLFLKKDHHKKTFGKTLIIGGDQGYLGSILIAGTSALKTGNRYIEILTTEDHTNKYNS